MLRSSNVISIAVCIFSLAVSFYTLVGMERKQKWVPFDYFVCRNVVLYYNWTWIPSICLPLTEKTLNEFYTVHADNMHVLYIHVFFWTKIYTYDIESFQIQRMDVSSCVAFCESAILLSVQCAQVFIHQRYVTDDRFHYLYIVMLYSEL